jgi:hypothetical protein
MPSDYPSFQKPTWPIRDWAGLEELAKTIYAGPTNPISPGSTWGIDIYTVPIGKKFFWLEDHVFTQIRGYAVYSLVGIGFLTEGWTDAYKWYSAVYAVPAILPAGITIHIDVTNEDIVSGRCAFYISGFEMPASKPEEPKSDDPIDLFKAGEFHYCNIFSLPNGEEVRIFTKIRDKFRNYLRVKNIYKPDEKVISQFKLKPEEAQEIIEISRQKPEKLIETLKNYEEKYGRKKLFGITI